MKRPSPNVMVLGYGRHGKDTFCNILKDRWGLAFTSSSMFCAERVMMPFFRSIGVHYDSAQACYDDRHTGDNRRIWYDQISAYNAHDPTRLARNIFAEYDIYAGLRNEREFFACKRAGLIDSCVWVSRSLHLPPEDDKSCTVGPWLADRTIDNNGSLRELTEQADDFARSLYDHPRERKSDEI